MNSVEHFSFPLYLTLRPTISFDKCLDQCRQSFEQQEEKRRRPWLHHPLLLLVDPLARRPSRQGTRRDRKR